MINPIYRFVEEELITPLGPDLLDQVYQKDLLDLIRELDQMTISELGLNLPESDSI